MKNKSVNHFQDETDGWENSDWNGWTGSDAYRAEKAYAESSGGYGFGGSFKDGSGKEVGFVNGQLQVWYPMGGDLAFQVEGKGFVDQYYFGAWGDPIGGSNNAINTTLNLSGGILSAPAGTMSLRGWGHDMLLKESQWLGNNGRLYSTKFYGSNKWLSGTQKAFRAAGSAAKAGGNILGGLGVMVSVGSSYNAFLNDRDNTSTWVDLTITGGLFIGGLAAGITGAPVVATFGIFYGVYRLTVGSNGDALIDQYFGYR
ncbi:hypothetical protein GCM10027284_01270 [Cyclobacterium sediminis]